MHLMVLVHKIEIYFWNGWIVTVRGIHQLLSPILIDGGYTKKPLTVSFSGKTILIAGTGLGLGFIAGYLFIMSLLQ